MEKRYPISNKQAKMIRKIIHEAAGLDDTLRQILKQINKRKGTLNRLQRDWWEEVRDSVGADPSKQYKIEWKVNGKFDPHIVEMSNIEIDYKRGE